MLWARVRRDIRRTTCARKGHSHGRGPQAVTECAERHEAYHAPTGLRSEGEHASAGVSGRIQRSLSQPPPVPALTRFLPLQPQKNPGPPPRGVSVPSGPSSVHISRPWQKGPLAPAPPPALLPVPRIKAHRHTRKDARPHTAPSRAHARLLPSPSPGALTTTQGSQVTQMKNPSPSLALKRRPCEHEAGGCRIRLGRSRPQSMLRTLCRTQAAHDQLGLRHVCQYVMPPC